MDNPNHVLSHLPDGAEIRLVSREQFHLALDCLENAFPDVGRGFFHAIALNDPGYDPSGSLAIWVNNRVVSYVQVFERTLLLDGEALRFGGIGSVGTHPKYRGRGYAKALLEFGANSFRTRGFQGGMLFTGIHPFYESLGWQKVTQRETLLPIDALKPLCQRGYRHRPMTEPDLDAVMDLYQKTQQAISGTLLRSRDYWLARPSWMNHPITVVFNEANQLCAYLYCTQYKTDVPTLHITEMACALSDDVPYLMSVLVEKAQDMRCTALQGLFPAMPSVSDWIGTSGLSPEPKNNPYMMWYSMPGFPRASDIQARMDAHTFAYWQTDAF